MVYESSFALCIILSVFGFSSICTSKRKPSRLMSSSLFASIRCLMDSFLRNDISFLKLFFNKVKLSNEKNMVSCSGVRNDVVISPEL